MKTYDAATVAPVTLNFITDLGASARAGSYVVNAGAADFRIVMQLGEATRAPMTIPAGVRWLFPSKVDSIQILPGADGEAWYQVFASL